MDLPRNKIKSVIAVLLVGLQITSQLPAKSTRPVTEIISEQSRSDDQYRPYHHGIPHGNPLAGNPKQARLHAQNQQAMFNAERKRQHRAQLQRWTKAPLQIDSYMKAYHESQESHQMALEQQQIKPVSATMPTPKKVQARQVKIKSNKHLGFSRPPPDIIKITKEDAIVNTDKNRNHRSYGSTDHVYYQYLEPKKYQTSVYLSPGTTYDQGVTINPNGNVGLTHTKMQEKETKLYTEAVPSKTQYIYPKQYGQMQNYQSAQETDVFNTMLHQSPNDQVSSLDAMLNYGKDVAEEGVRDTLYTPTDLFFYSKDSPKLHDNNHKQITPTYASSYVPYYPEIKDHTPIMENIDDIEDTNKHTKFKSYGLQPVLATNAPQEQFIDKTTTKNNNYYKVEVASQTISAPYKSTNTVPIFYNKEVNPTLQTLHYKPAYKDPIAEDFSEKYLHHNVQPVGIHPLSDDGSGVPAYGDGNVSNYGTAVDVKGHVRNTYEKPKSIKSLPDNDNKSIVEDPKVLPRSRLKNEFHVRKVRSLDVDPFLLSEKTNSKIADNGSNLKTPLNITNHIIVNPIINQTENADSNTPKADAYTRFRSTLHQKYNLNQFGTFLTTPDFPVGVASEYSDYDDPLGNDYDNDKIEDYGDDFYDDDYDDEYNDSHNTNSQYDSFKSYAPSAGYGQNVDLTGAYSKKHRKYNGFPHISPTYSYPKPVYGLPNSFDYNVHSTFRPVHPTYSSLSPIAQSFGEPIPLYGPPPTNIPQLSNMYHDQYDHHNHNSEPVYMITQSQLKNLIGDQNINLQHYDIYQFPAKPKHGRGRRPPPRKYRNKYKYHSRQKDKKHRNIKKIKTKLHRLHIL